MANIDKALIDRLQKDLEGYTTNLHTSLEKMAGTHMQNVAPIYQRIQRQLVRKIKTIYAAAGAEENLNKATALMNKAKRLEALASQITADLKTAETQLQPYYTGALTDMYERSYYLTGFGIAQAARVGATLPILNSMSVLGAIANPWLSDGANYSSRLRANTAQLADTMKQTVTRAVAEGWGVAEAARAIEQTCGEGYYNSVRLLRTELNRASAQGANYAYMQNADILDGKRWNATLDSRTAAKDADNDNRLYDLDYDTVERPGVPGQRIPNHPNCRCSWTPVLSSLGVSEKLRTARKGDGKDSYGENYKTTAENYREYAKERGLPDLDERLKKDNLKSYLRPGETVADVNKKVVRWQTKGGTISVPKPYWEEIKKLNPNLEALAQKHGVTFEVDDGIELDDRVYQYIDDTINRMNSKLPEGYQFNEVCNKVRFERYRDMAEADGSALDKVMTLNSKPYEKGLHGFESTLEDIDALYDSDSARFHPKHKNPLYIFTHETGHLVHDQMVRKLYGKDPRFEGKAKLKSMLEGIRKEVLEHFGLTAQSKNHVAIGKALSDYATVRPNEFFAEAFMEAIDNPTPRPMAAKFWEVLEGKIGKATPKGPHIPKNLQAVFDADGNFDYGRFATHTAGFDKKQHYDFVMDLSEQLIKQEIGEIIPAGKASLEVVDRGGVKTLIRKVFRKDEKETLDEFMPYIERFNAAATLDEQLKIVNEFAAYERTITDPAKVMPYNWLFSEMKHAQREPLKAAVFKAFQDYKHMEFKLDAKQKYNITIDPRGSVRANELKRALDRANEWLSKFLHPNNVPGNAIHLERLKKDARAYAYSNIGRVHLPTNTDAGTAVHESAHCIHTQNKRTVAMVTEFFKERTDGEALTTIYRGTSERGYKDKFIDHYVGKFYSHDTQDDMGREVVSMGMQYMYENPMDFYTKDPHHFKLIFSLMRGLQ